MQQVLQLSRTIKFSKRLSEHELIFALFFTNFQNLVSSKKYIFWVHLIRLLLCNDALYYLESFNASLIIVVF